jgi:hypothetical protein
MTEFDGFFLPLDVPDANLRTLEVGDVQVRYPDLSADQLLHIHRLIVDKRNQSLVRTPVARIVEAIDQTAARLLDDISAITALLSSATGYSRPVVAETLQHMFADWRAPALDQLLSGELPDATMLDAPIPDPDIPKKLIAAYGHPTLFQVFSGNVPGVAVTSIVRALLVKSATLGKVASGEPILPIIFAKTLGEVAPDLAGSIALTYWPAIDEELMRTSTRLCDAVVVYGGAEAVRAVADAGTGKRIVAHGPRLSFGIVGPNAEAGVAADAARAIAAYDQQGCVSPHAIYVHGDHARARVLAQQIANELESVAKMLPRGRISAEDAVAIRNARTAAEFSDGAEVFGRDDASYSVIYEADTAFRVSCLNRVVYVKPLADLAQLASLLPAGDVLQSAAIAGFDESEKTELIRMLGLSGVSRITTFQQLPWPPMHWHHDGSAPLRELLRWQDIELG